MSGRRTTGRLAVLLVVGLVQLAAASERSVGLEVEVVSRYVWRGVVLDDGWSVQPNLVFTCAFNDRTSVELAAWWNAALETHGSETHQDEVFEQDLTLTFAHKLGDAVLLWAGSTYYWNPFSDVEPGSPTWHTTELFLGGEWSAAPMSIQSTLSHDLEKIKGWYLDLGGSLSLPLSGRVAVEPALHLGLALDENPNPVDPDEQSWYLKNGLVDGGVALGLTRAAQHGLSLGGALHYAHRFDGIREHANVVWASVKLGYVP